MCAHSARAFATRADRKITKSVAACGLKHNTMRTRYNRARVRVDLARQTII